MVALSSLSFVIGCAVKCESQCVAAVVLWPPRALGNEADRCGVVGAAMKEDGVSSEMLQ